MDTLIGQKPRAPAPLLSAGAGATPGAVPGTPPPETQAGAPTGAGEIIVDGTQATFMVDVIEASRSIPVLVDFWATWCGPCKQLTPVLEKVVRAAGGRVKLVKIDIDANPALVRQLTQLGLPMQSVPTVAAFWQGQIADVFQGALPESEVKRLVEGLLKIAGGSMPAADLLAEARAAMGEQRFEDAGSTFSALLQEDPENPDAWAGLVRVLMALGQDGAAADALEQVPAKLRNHPEVSGARSALALAGEGREASQKLAQLQAAVATDPADHQARYELATALNATGDREAAAAALLDIMKRDRGWNEGAARLQLLKLFEAWGLTDPATIAARRKLSALLFS